MRTTIKTVAALLIVFSAVSAKANVDSVRVTTSCRVLPQDKEDIYKVIYQASQKEDVLISFKNTNDQLVHAENVKSTEGFVKSFNLGNLPDGSYKVAVEAPGYSYEESIKLGDVSAFNFILRDMKDRKIALVGSRPEGKDLSLVILNADNEEIYKEDFSSATQVKKQYQFGPYAGKEVTFLLFHGERLVKEEKFKF